MTTSPERTVYMADFLYGGRCAEKVGVEGRAAIEDYAHRYAETAAKADAAHDRIAWTAPATNDAKWTRRYACYMRETEASTDSDHIAAIAYAGDRAT